MSDPKTPTDPKLPEGVQFLPTDPSEIKGDPLLPHDTVEFREGGLLGSEVMTEGCAKHFAVTIDEQVAALDAAFRTAEAKLLATDKDPMLSDAGKGFRRSEIVAEAQAAVAPFETEKTDFEGWLAQAGDEVVDTLPIGKDAT